MKIQRSIARFISFLGIGLILLAIGCSEDQEESSEEQSFVTTETVETKLVMAHPILDAQVHKGDSLLIQLIALKDEGLLLEGDMTRLVGAFVSEHGSYDNPDSLLLSMTYRQLLDRALLLDLSAEYGYDSTDCEGCNDSIMIFLPGTDARLFVGMGPKSLQLLIKDALKPNHVSDRYHQAPYNQKLDQQTWQETIGKLAMERQDAFDLVLFGNVLLLLTREGEPFDDFTYGHILTVIDSVKKRPEFDRIRTYLENLASDTAST